MTRGPGTDLSAGGGELGRLMASTDWAGTAVGPVEGWPTSLRTAVGIMLRSRFPMFMGWGEPLTMFYNDAYVPVLGGKHPWALGRSTQQVWAEIWDVLGPLAGEVMAGRATFAEDLLLIMQRAEFTEETYFTFSYSPIPGDDPGAGPGGLFCACTETTGRVIGERRLRVLSGLGDIVAATAPTAEQACTAALEVLGRARADVPFALAYLRDGDHARLVTGYGVVAGGRISPPVVPHADGGRTIWRVVTGGKAELRTGLAGDYPGAIEPAVIGDAVPSDALVLPLAAAGEVEPVGALVAGISPYRQLDEEYRSFFDLVAGAVSTALTDALAYQHQRRRAEELAELDRAKTEFFSNISHEFRTPLTLIRGPVRELLDTGAAEDPARVRAELAAVDRNAGRLARLVNNLLDFSRVQAGRAQARYRPTDLAAFTADLASMFRAAMARAGLGYTVDCAPVGEPVHVDREMWENVVLNLLSNALKFTFTGAIEVALRRDGCSQVVLTVTDSGVGIPDAELARLFERFHRAPADRGRSAEGSGIGLALVRELVGLHAGTVEVASTEGKGTTFTVRVPLGTEHLPADQLIDPPDPAENGDVAAVADPYVTEALRWLLPAADVADAPTAAAIGPGEASAGASVLVVDDNADMCEYLTRLLSPPYRVRSTGDGRAGLAAARADPPDLVITDVMMPGLDGFGLLAALRADPATATLPVIVLSARAGQEAAIEGLAAGADEYLVKPFTAAELLARVRSALTLAHVRQRETRWRTALVEAMQDGFYVVELDTEPPRVVEINEAFTDILGYDRDQLPYAAPFPWWPDPAAHAGQRAEIERQLAAGEPGRHVLPVRHRDGHEVWIAVAHAMLTDPDTGRRVRVGTVRDVTAEHAAQLRAQQLRRVTTDLAAAATLGDVADALMTALVDAFGAAAQKAFAVDPQHGGLRLLHAQGGHADVVARLATIPLDAATPVTDAARTGEAVWLRDHDDWSTRYPQLEAEHRASGYRAALVLPLRAAQRVVAVVAASFPTARTFPATEREFALTLATTAAQAPERAVDADHRRGVAETLQHQLLPHTPPVIDHLALATRYLPGTAGVQAGGDWYDVIALDEVRTAVVVGDVVGQGASAAAVMGQLRTALATILRTRAADTPDVALAHLNRIAADTAGARASSAVCLIVDTAARQIRWSCAGHPPPLLVPVGGPARFLDDAAPGGPTHDDIALVAARLLPAPLHERCPARPTELARTRRAVYRWATQTGLDEQTVDDLQLALGEATANAVEHAYRGAPPAHPIGELDYTVRRVDDTTVEATVTDHGTWRPPPPDRGYRGRGLEMIKRLADQMSVDHGPGGTTVRCTLTAAEPEPSVTRPATTARRAPADARPAGVHVDDGPDGNRRIILRGGIDLPAVHAIRPAPYRHLNLDREHPPPGEPSVLDLELDLDAVTYLASAGVGLILEITEQAAAHGHRLRLTYHPHSVAARVLQLAQLATPAAGEPTTTTSSRGRAERSDI